MSAPLEQLPDEQRAWLNSVAQSAHLPVEVVLSVVVASFMTQASFMAQAGRLPLPAHLGTDGLTDEERLEDAAHYYAMVARDLTAEEIADLVAAKELPRRQLRRVG